MEKSWEWNQQQYTGFMDLQKAFERVPRDQLWQGTGYDEYEIPIRLIKAIRSIYKKNESRVKTGNRYGRLFCVRSGVRQDGVLSPLLFILYMDIIIKEVEGYLNTNALVFVYAYDMCHRNEIQYEMESGTMC